MNQLLDTLVLWASSQNLLQGPRKGTTKVEAEISLTLEVNDLTMKKKKQQEEEEEEEEKWTGLQKKRAR
jgi:hypothetical protein